MASVNDIINKLSSINNDEKIPVTIPSSSKDMQFSPISVKQQKNLLKQTLGGVMSLPDLLVAFNEIVLENCKENADSLMVYDRYAVLLELRKNSHGNIITIDSKQYDITSLPKGDKVSPSLNSGDVSYKSIKVEVKTPTLKEDTIFIKKSTADNKKNKVDDEKELISSMYVLEIVKHISVIKFDGDELRFDTLPLSEKIKIVENLPVSLNQKILNFISKVRTYENKLITFEDGVTLPIDSLFASEE
jgi:hypothetical protein